MTGEPMTIRGRLESDAWKNHPQFAAVQALKPTRKPPGRPLKWQDRALLALSALLLLLLIFRVETATAQQDRCGLEFRDEGADQRCLAVNEEIPNLLPAGNSAYTASFSQTAIGWVAQLILSFIALLVATGMLAFSAPSRKGLPGDASSPMATSPPSS